MVVELAKVIQAPSAFLDLLPTQKKTHTHKIEICERCTPNVLIGRSSTLSSKTLLP